jgi:hypothetical protein
VRWYNELDELCEEVRVRFGQTVLSRAESDASDAVVVPFGAQEMSRSSAARQAAFERELTIRLRRLLQVEKDVP